MANDAQSRHYLLHTLQRSPTGKVSLRYVVDVDRLISQSEFLLEERSLLAEHDDRTTKAVCTIFGLPKFKLNTHSALPLPPSRRRRVSKKRSEAMWSRKLLCSWLRDK